MEREPLGVNEVLLQRLRRAGGPIEIQAFGHHEDRKRGPIAHPCLQYQHPVQDESPQLEYRRRARPPCPRSAAVYAARRRLRGAWRCTPYKPDIDVASASWSKLHTQARSISGLHLCLYARPRPSSSRSRFAAPLWRQPTIRPSNGAHPRTSQADPSTAWDRTQYRSPDCSRIPPDPALTRQTEFLVHHCLCAIAAAGRTGRERPESGSFAA